MLSPAYKIIICLPAQHSTVGKDNIFGGKSQNQTVEPLNGRCLMGRAKLSLSAAVCSAQSSGA